MRLTRQSEIAIGVLAACARSPSQKITTVQAAEASATTKDHAAQVVNLLVHAGFLCTERGRSGGIALAVPAAKILLGEVLRRIQLDLVPRAGSDDHSAYDAAIVTFNAIFDAAEATFMGMMNSYSIADLVSTSPKKPDAFNDVANRDSSNCGVSNSIRKMEAYVWQSFVEQKDASKSTPVI